MMRVNLELEEPEINKTFTIDANEEYTTRLYGQGLRSGKSVETMPNFVGISIDEVRQLATTNNIKLNLIETFPGDEYFNYLYNTDVVTSQSIHENTVVNSSTNLTVYVNAVTANISEEEEQENNETIEDEELTDIIPGLEEDTEE